MAKYVLPKNWRLKTKEHIHWREDSFDVKEACSIIENSATEEAALVIFKTAKKKDYDGLAEAIDICVRASFKEKPPPKNYIKSIEYLRDRLHTPTSVRVWLKKEIEFESTITPRRRGRPTVSPSFLILNHIRHYFQKRYGKPLHRATAALLRAVTGWKWDVSTVMTQYSRDRKPSKKT